jgi:macrolide transport system ATP-binding/permease protein
MRHIAAMLSIESAVAGVAGALLGLTLGLATILVVTIVNRWTPIFDLRAALLAVAAGVIVAVIGSLSGAIRAFRTDPNDTLRPHT